MKDDSGMERWSQVSQPGAARLCRSWSRCKGRLTRLTEAEPVLLVVLVRLSPIGGSARRVVAFQQCASRHNR